MANPKVLSEVINDFVETYFINLDFSKMATMAEQDVLNVLSQVEKTLVSIIEAHYEDDEPELWHNRELCLRALIVLTQIEYFASILEETGHLERGIILLSRILESFNKKVMEDPVIVKAIQENRLDEELRKNFPPETLSSRKSNFEHLLHVDESNLNAVPEKFEKIPEKF